MSFFRRNSGLAAILAGALWILFVAWLDVRTGLQLKLGPFYLLPVLLVAWEGGALPGILAALVAAGAWRGLEMIWRPGSTPGWILFWDASIHLLSFTAVALFVSWARSLVLRERELVHDLSGLLADVRELEGLLPMCAWCKKVRDDRGYWQQIETYISAHTKADWTHGICPECQMELMDGEVSQEQDFSIGNSSPSRDQS